jgi:lipopolysaccharide/colanic/teichoic acid biosynthesis glycosyltransferase
LKKDSWLEKIIKSSYTEEEWKREEEKFEKNKENFKENSLIKKIILIIFSLFGFILFFFIFIPLMSEHQTNKNNFSKHTSFKKIK